MKMLAVSYFYTHVLFLQEIKKHILIFRTILMQQMYWDGMKLCMKMNSGKLYQYNMGLIYWSGTRAEKRVLIKTKEKQDRRKKLIVMRPMQLIVLRMKKKIQSLFLHLNGSTNVSVKKLRKLIYMEL